MRLFLRKKIFQTCLISTLNSVSASSLLLESISAYDSQIAKEEGLLKFAEELAEMLLNKDPVTIINKFQIIKRKRPLSNDEIVTLVTMRKKNKENIIRCAISILLEEYDEAKELLSKLPETERIRITNYPLFNLVKK